jgi:hypothetical protein
VAPTVWLAKVRLAGDTLAAGAVPVPVMLAVCEPPLALSVKVTTAVRVPRAAGLKVTATAQLAPAATLEPQLFVWVKSLALVPESAMLVMLKAALPELVRVRFWAAPVAPTAWPAKVRLEGDRVTAGEVPVPVMLTV